MSIPTFGSIKTFADVKNALDRIRAYFLELSPGTVVGSSRITVSGGDVMAGTTITKDSDLVEYQGATGRIIKDGGLSHADVAIAVAAVGYSTINILTGAIETVTEAGRLVICNRPTDMTLNLLPAEGVAKTYIIKNINAGIVTITPDGAETIDGEADQALLEQCSMAITDYAPGLWTIIGYSW